MFEKLNLPPETLINKRIAKDRFSNAIARNLNISSIVWLAKISPQHMNISASDDFPEFEIFEITFNSEAQPETIIEISQIPQKIIFIIKDQNQTSLAVVVNNKLYQTNFQEPNFQGNTAETIWQNIARQIISNQVGKTQPAVNFQNWLDNLEESQKLQRQINSLNAKIQKEIQLNKKQQLARERQILYNKLNSLK